MPMADEGDRTKWAAIERLLKAAHEFAKGQKVGVPKEDLEKLRLEFAHALEMMGEESKLSELRLPESDRSR